MSNFPVFLNLKNKKVLLIGGGNIAYDKLISLLEFTQNITILSQNISQKILDISKNSSFVLLNRRYEHKDLEGFDIIVCSIDDIPLQKQIYYETRKFNCLYNCVDLKEYCDFIFSAYIKKGDLTIAVSTNGSSPAFAKQFKSYLQDLIPKNVEQFLQDMKEHRKSMPKGKKRMDFFKEEVKKYLKTWEK